MIVDRVAGTTRAARPRRLPIPMAILGMALLASAGSYIAAGLTADPTSRGGPTAPPSRVVLQVPGDAPPVSGANADGRMALPDRIAFWSRRVTEQPSDFLSYIQLALTWSEQGRLRVDLNAYQRAATAADRAIELAPAYPQALAVRASIRFATHDFAGAEVDARAALKVSPSDPSALSILGDTLIELGRIDEAAATYDRLAPIAAGPAFDIRQARLAFVRGSLSPAVDLARKALIGASGGGAAGAEATSPTELGFYHFALGEYARLAGDAPLAREQFGAALALRPDDIGALVGAARIDAFDGDLDAAIGELQHATAIAPTPEAEGLLADLLNARGAPGDLAAARVADGTVRLTGQLSAIAGTVFDRVLIQYDLDHGMTREETVDRARAALAIRGDAGGHDLLAWALHRLGRDDEAWAESQGALTMGAADARTMFHAGAIAASRGDGPEAGRLLKAALALGPALDPAARDEAAAILAILR